MIENQNAINFGNRTKKSAIIKNSIIMNVLIGKALREFSAHSLTEIWSLTNSQSSFLYSILWNGFVSITAFIWSILAWNILENAWWYKQIEMKNAGNIGSRHALKNRPRFMNVNSKSQLSMVSWSQGNLNYKAETFHKFLQSLNLVHIHQSVRAEQILNVDATTLE